MSPAIVIGAVLVGAMYNKLTSSQAGIQRIAQNVPTSHQTRIVLAAMKTRNPKLLKVAIRWLRREGMHKTAQKLMAKRYGLLMQARWGRR